MQRIYNIDTLKNINREVQLQGWVQVVRNHGRVAFLELRDKSGLIQVVLPAKLGQSYSIKPEYVVAIKGKVVKRPPSMVNKKSPLGLVELQAEKVEVLVKAKPLPFDTGGPELEVELPTLLDHRSLSLRHPKIRSIFSVQDVVLKTFRRALREKGFTEISVPTIVPTATEGGSEVFPIKYFDHTAYLAQSPQFYKQIMVGVFERVFTASHAYRAEPSVTTRHMTEYVGLDAEMGFIKSWEEIMAMADYVVKEIFTAVGKECEEALDYYGITIPKTISDTPKIKLKQAQEIIFKRTGTDHRDEPDLDPEDEREICRWALEEKGSDILFITHYPTKKRPMYTYPDPKNPEYTLSFDLLGRGVEWITGGQRINDYQQLVNNIKKWGCNVGDFAAPYLQAFKYGMPEEGGFCMGLERITQNILGLPNIRQACLFPRDMTRIDFRLAAKNKHDKSKTEKTPYANKSSKTKANLAQKN
jgi:nondiscriminating aspartyl-tRNA synthetase